MKLQFEHNLDYQRAAVDAVRDLFAGQEVCRTEFTVTAPRSLFADAGAQGDLPGMPGGGIQIGLGLAESDLGIGNRLQLLPEELLANLNRVQTRHGLEPSENLASRDFTVEMEAGTGKTHGYLGSLFDDALRDAEVAKIKCGGVHFAAITSASYGAKFVRATSVGDFEKRW